MTSPDRLRLTSLGPRRIVVVDDQIGRDGSSHRDWFLGQAGRPADDFVFLSGQDPAGRNRADTVVRRVGELWDAGRIALVLLDVRFDDSADPQGDRFGFRLLEALLGRYPELPIAMLTTETDTRDEAGRGRAVGFLPKKELNAEALHRRLFRLGLVPPDPSDRLLGTSTRFLAALRQVRLAVDDSMELLLLGETGTGKTEIARYAHAVSPRRAGPFETWTSTRGDADLQADQLFGHWEGAFTGAVGHRAGAAERAHEGTLFIDEIAELSANGQVLLLEYRYPGHDGRRRVRRAGLYPANAPRHLNEKWRQTLDLGDRVYSDKEGRILVDTFLVTATNRPILDEAWREKHGFRRDLHNRLGNAVEVPPLRDRPADIEPLFLRFLDLGDDVGVTPEAWDRLAAHAWRDNLAELRRVADGVRMQLGTDFREVHAHHLEGLLDDPAVAPRAGAPAAASAQPPATAPGALATGGGAAPGTWVDAELAHRRDLAERLRTAVIETRTPRGTGTVPDILHHAMGTRYPASDAKREIKGILSVWFKPNAREAERWNGRDAYRRHRQWVESDAVLSSLYRYANDDMSWNEAQREIDRALDERTTT